MDIVIIDTESKRLNCDNAASKPMPLSADIQCAGSIQFMITQNRASINETISKGSYNYDMADFEIGKIRMVLVNAGATNLSGKIIVETTN